MSITTVMPACLQNFIAHHHHLTDTMYKYIPRSHDRWVFTYLQYELALFPTSYSKLLHYYST